MAKAKDRDDARTSGWLACGCHILLRQQVVHCEYHQKTGKMMALLDNLRKYFLTSAGGEDSPYVKKIDELVPRRD